MYMVENMILAETVVSLAAGAIAKLQIRPLRIRAAADGALMAVTPLLLPPLLLLGGGLKLDGLMGDLVFCPAPPPK